MAKRLGSMQWAGEARVSRVGQGAGKAQRAVVRLSVNQVAAMALLCAFMAASPAQAQAKTKSAVSASLPDGSGEKIIRREQVPSRAAAHGEVRLLERDAALVVQVLLYSKLLKRVVARIGEKEAAAWPKGSTGHKDSLRYVEGLRQAQAAVWERFKQRSDRADRRQKLLIELVDSSTGPFVALYGLAIDETPGGHVRIRAKRPMLRLDLSPAYVRANMRLIVADAFGLSRPEVLRLFEQARAVLPAAAPPVAASAGAGKRKNTEPRGPTVPARNAGLGQDRKGSSPLDSGGRPPNGGP